MLLSLFRDAQHGEKEGDPKPRYSDHIAAGWVPYITMDTAQSTYAALNQIWSHQPVLMRNTPLVSGLVGRWGLQPLVSACCEHMYAPN